MITPKEDFFKHNAKTWPDVVDSPLFRVAAQVALAQMAIHNAGPPDMASAASYQWRMDGAKQFLAILMHLADPPIERRAHTDQNLNHRT